MSDTGPLSGPSVKLNRSRRDADVRSYQITNDYSHTVSGAGMAETLTALYRRNEVFWVGLFAVVLGAVLPETLALGGLDVSRLFVVTGGGLLITSVFVVYRPLTPT